jgi:hypothetical protein
MFLSGQKRVGYKYTFNKLTVNKKIGKTNPWEWGAVKHVCFEIFYLNAMLVLNNYYIFDLRFSRQ